MDGVARADRRRRRRAWLLVLASWSGAAFLLLGRVPPEAERLATGGADKLVHVVLFVLLAATLERALRLEGVRRRLAITLAACVLYGLLTELAQATTGYRSLELADWLADVVGAALFVGLAGFFGWLWPRRRSP